MGIAAPMLPFLLPGRMQIEERPTIQIADLDPIGVDETDPPHA